MTQLELATNYLEQHEADMIALWENIVRLESPSADTAAVTKLGEYLADYCASIGRSPELRPLEGAAPALSAVSKAGPHSPVMFLGHLDTVHPTGCFGDPMGGEG